jgi:hypothetical protein
MADETEAAGPTDLEAVRADYEGNLLTLDEVAERHGISKTTIDNRRRSEGWLSRKLKKQVSRGDIISRMFRILERQIIQLEQSMKAANQPQGEQPVAHKEVSEKEVAVLGKLVGTLEKLITIETAAVDRPKPVAKGRDMHTLRDQLAERIEQLKRA